MYGVTDPTTVDDFTHSALDNIVWLSHKVSEAQVGRARMQLKASVLSHLDDSGAVFEDVGRQVLTYGRRLSPAEIFARIDAVDASVVKDTAKRFLNDADVAVTAIGPITELPDYNWIRRHTYWLRY